jgi:sugar PTS system EIIA component
MSRTEPGYPVGGPELLVLSPFDGVVVALGRCSDPVFAEGLLGPGVAVLPAATGEVLDVLSPVDGSVSAQHPHAVVLRGAAGPVLVHLGLDTVSLRGQGFHALVGRGDRVDVGARLVAWDTDPTVSAGLSLVSPVVALQASPQDVRVLVADGQEVLAREPLLAWRGGRDG